MCWVAQHETGAPCISPEMVTGGSIRKCFLNQRVGRAHLTSELHKGWGWGVGMVELRLREVNQLS